MTLSTGEIAARLRFMAETQKIQSMQQPAAPIELRTAVERFPLKRPFTITGYTITEIDCLLVTLRRGRAEGRGEAVGVYYHDDQPERMREEVEAARQKIEAGIARAQVPSLVRSTGAQNALDCALWELEAKERGAPVWSLAGIKEPEPRLTTWTIGAEAPGAMAEIAQNYEGARAIKLKLLGDGDDAERVRRVRNARPDVWLGVDANQGFEPDTLSRLLPALISADVRLIEQPFAVGRDADLDSMECSIPLAADESVQSFRDVPSLVGRYQYANIKLDKTGGLTEALHLAHLAQAQGLKLMVGNMLGTSLAMAPAFLVGQLCDVVDLDGPLLLAADRQHAVTYRDGLINCPEEVWGHLSRQ
jgi:L-Ala-D/L-Glu epimerase